MSPFLRPRGLRGESLFRRSPASSRLCDLVPDELRATCNPYCAACHDCNNRGTFPGPRERFVTAELEPEEPYVWDDPIAFQLELLHDELERRERGCSCG